MIGWGSVDDGFKEKMYQEFINFYRYHFHALTEQIDIFLNIGEYDVSFYQNFELAFLILSDFWNQWVSILAFTVFFTKWIAPFSRDLILQLQDFFNKVKNDGKWREKHQKTHDDFMTFIENHPFAFYLHNVRSTEKSDKKLISSFSYYKEFYTDVTPYVIYSELQP